jgi:predicted amidophosphoribosyltransferase
MHETVCLMPYYKYWLYENGQKVKNPEFTVDCGKLLDLKGNGQNVQPAANHFAKLLAQRLKDFGPLQGLAKVEIAIVPSSEKGKTSTGLYLLAHKLSTLDKRLVMPKQHILTRTRTIEKLHSGGNRQGYVHLQSIDVTIHPHSRRLPVLLLDDIATTGNSIMACTDLLYGAGSSLVIPVVVGRTR